MRGVGLGPALAVPAYGPIPSVRGLGRPAGKRILELAGVRRRRERRSRRNRRRSGRRRGGRPRGLSSCWRRGGGLRLCPSRRRGATRWRRSRAGSGGRRRRRLRARPARSRRWRRLSPSDAGNGRRGAARRYRSGSGRRGAGRSQRGSGRGVLSRRAGSGARGVGARRHTGTVRAGGSLFVGLRAGRRGGQQRQRGRNPLPDSRRGPQTHRDSPPGRAFSFMAHPREKRAKEDGGGPAKRFAEKAPCGGRAPIPGRGGWLPRRRPGPTRARRSSGGRG
jgi:hypothetical protein